MVKESPNLSFIFLDADFTCRVRAATRIAKGCEITTTYTHTLAGTMYRNRHLLDTKYFKCTCPRCLDPTELGSHFSTLLCHQCRDGYVTVVEPLNEKVRKVTLITFDTSYIFFLLFH